MDPWIQPQGLAGRRGSPEAALPRGFSSAEELGAGVTLQRTWKPHTLHSLGYSCPCPCWGARGTQSCSWEPLGRWIDPHFPALPRGRPLTGVCKGSPLTFEVASVCREERGESISIIPSLPPSSPSTPNSSLQALGWGAWGPPQGWHRPPPSSFHPPAGPPICGVTPGGAVTAALWDVPPQGPPQCLHRLHPD